MLIRNFLPEDTDRICEFKKKSVGINFQDSPYNEEIFVKSLLKHASFDPNTVKVAEVGGEIAGYIWFKIINSSVGIFARLEHLFVIEKYRKKGFGKKLIEAAEEYCKHHGIKKIKLTVTNSNESAINLYNNLGYETRRFVMEKNL